MVADRRLSHTNPFPSLWQPGIQLRFCRQVAKSLPAKERHSEGEFVLLSRSFEVSVVLKRVQEVQATLNLLIYS